MQKKNILKCIKLAPIMPGNYMQNKNLLKKLSLKDVLNELSKGNQELEIIKRVQKVLKSFKRRKFNHFL